MTNSKINNSSFDYDVAVIGGGPAGLAASISASKKGARVLLIEREHRLGGVLKQCIHDGFGLLRFGERLSGPEYAHRYMDMLAKTPENPNTKANTISTLTPVDVKLLTFVSSIDRQGNCYKLTLASPDGAEIITSKTIVFANGCRERTSKQVAIHGSRPSGVLTAGAAQHYVNLMGQMPGKDIVILGSGDIGLIMARRLTLEGGHVIGVYEAKHEPSGLSRNIYQCLKDFDIPLHLSKTVVECHGRERLEGVTIAQLTPSMEIISGTEEYVKCDCLILSVGLIPENELTKSLGIDLNPITKGPDTDQNYHIKDGIFSCGNCLHVNDLVDYVSISGERAGEEAAKYALFEEKLTRSVVPTHSDDIAYLVPNHLSFTEGEAIKEPVQFFFRVRRTMEKSKLSVRVDGKEVFKRNYIAVKPPEMETVKINLSELSLDENSKITFDLQEIGGTNVRN